MEEIKIGEYVRTDYGISKVIKNVDKYVTNEQISVDFIGGMYHQVIYKNKVVKHSKNITDLIQERDLIFYKNFPNTEQLGVVRNYPNRDGTLSLGVNFYKLNQLKITGILTKEQVQMNYFRLEN